MKIRQGFVSNSSSSSFIIGIDNFNAEFLKGDLDKNIRDLLEIAKSMGWKAEVFHDYLIATTFMDNEDFLGLLTSKYLMHDQNIIKIGSYSGFNHSIDELKRFVWEFLLSYN